MPRQFKAPPIQAGFNIFVVIAVLCGPLLAPSRSAAAADATRRPPPCPAPSQQLGEEPPDPLDPGETPSCKAQPSATGGPSGHGPKGWPSPRPGRHIGVETTSYNSIGIIGASTVVNPAVPHPSTSFLSQRILAKSCNESHWIEVGWVEAGWRGDAQYIYTYDSASQLWRFFDQYVLGAGRKITVELIHSGGGTWKALLNWNGQWHELHSFNPGPNTLGCGNESYVEPWSESDERFAFPSIKVGGNSADLRLHPCCGGTWEQWTSVVPTQETLSSPDNFYTATITNPYWDFSVHAGNRNPVVSLDVSPARGDLTTPFTAEIGTSDPDGEDVMVTMVDWGDGDQGTARSHRYTSPGRYIVRVTGRDPRGGRTTTSRAIRVCVAASVGCPQLALSEIPSDPYVLDQWALDRVQAIEAWEYEASRGFGIRLATIDSGLALDHPDFSCADKIELVPGSDLIEESDMPEDESGHGTLVAGVAAACADDQIGVAGVAPKATLMPFRFGSSGSNWSTVATAIRRASDGGAHIIMIAQEPAVGATSLIPDLFSEATSAIEYATAQGSVVVAPAGNQMLPFCEYPGLVRGVLCVAATDARDARATYSSWPFKTEPLGGSTMVAPGGEQAVFCNIYSETVLSTYPVGLDRCADGRDGYRSTFGTSLAVAHAAGAAALTYNAIPDERSADAAGKVVNLLLGSADDLGSPGFDPVFGHGRLNVLKAVRSASEHPGEVFGGGVKVSSGFTVQFSCHAVAAGGVPQFTSVRRCYAYSTLHGTQRNAPAVTTPGAFAATASDAIDVDPPVYYDGICWEVAAQFVGGREAVSEGCEIPLPVPP